MKRFISIILAASLLLSISFCFSSTTYAASLSAPKGMTAYALSTGKITVKWNKAKSAKKYYVYRSTSKDKNFKRIAIVKNPKYTSANLKKNTRYYFKVKSVSGKKKSKYSTTVSAKTHKTYSKEKLKKAYGAKVQSYLKKYGEPKTKLYSNDAYNDFTSYYVDGVSVVTHKDFNNDGIPELVICYSKDLKFTEEEDYYYYCEDDSDGSGFFCEIFRYTNGKAERVHKCRQKMDGTGLDVPRYICFARYNHKDYLVYQPDGDGWVPTSHKALVDGKMKTVNKFEPKYNSKTETLTYYKNGKKISEKEYMKNADYFETEILKAIFTSGISESKCESLISSTNTQIEKY
ncbi:MAG: hypothetical protein E7570_04330 [Ruminococcaceae bacterium]|nr:hypothetical protein [Oscillospiraceae bacterium]